jgi:DNA-binding protein H-NS
MNFSGRLNLLLQKSAAVIKYRKDEHNYWVGRGPKPKWVKEVEERGESIEQYRVDA